MTFLATASGLMMERVRSTAILGLQQGKYDKCEEIQDYIMRVAAAYRPPAGRAECNAKPSKLKKQAGRRPPLRPIQEPVRSGHHPDRARQPGRQSRPVGDDHEKDQHRD